MAHARACLTTDDAILLPAAATVYAQAVAVHTRDVCGFNMSVVDQHRWSPAFLCGEALFWQEATQKPSVASACTAPGQLKRDASD